MITVYLISVLDDFLSDSFGCPITTCFSIHTHIYRIKVTMRFKFTEATTSSVHQSLGMSTLQLQSHRGRPSSFF